MKEGVCQCVDLISFVCGRHVMLNYFTIFDYLRRTFLWISQI